MTTVDEIKSKLTNNDIPNYSGDSDDTTVIIYDGNRKEIEDVLKGMKYSISIGYNGFVIIPKE